MKRIIAFGFAASIVASAAGALGYWYAMRQMPGMASMTTTDAKTSTAGAGAAGQNDTRKVLYWHDPMVPGHKFDKPGKSPFMDMQLVPVYADEGADEGKISISPRVVQNLGVRTIEAVKGSIAQKVDAAGSVAYNERNVAVVQARVSAYVEKLYARAPLDSVRKGQALVQMLAPEWVAVQEEYLALRRMQLSGMEELRSAARQRLTLAGMTEGDIRAIERGGKVQARITLRAPINGVITELGVREGMTVMPGTTLFRINDLASVWVNAEVPEAQAAAVTPGNAVQARTPAYPGTVFNGRVAAILPEVNPATRTLKVRIELANPGGRLSPGMFASVDFAAAGTRDMLLVPTEAVIQTGKRSVVLLAEGEGKFKPVDVEIGTESGGQTEIREGVEAGQKVVVSGQFLIDSEASLKATTTRMEAIPAASEQSAGEHPAGGAQAAETHRAEGKLERIGKDAVTISHGPVPSLSWGPMTMDFRIPPTGLPKDLANGDQVSFEFHAGKGGGFELNSVKPIKPAPSGSRSSPAAAARQGGKP
jgi:membrane fusion protein, copper/silver efflux system